MQQTHESCEEKYHALVLAYNKMKRTNERLYEVIWKLRDEAKEQQKLMAEERQGLKTQQQRWNKVSDTAFHLLETLHELHKDSPPMSEHNMWQEITDFAPKALKFTQDIVEGTIPAPLNAKLRAAFFLLGIAGYSPIQKIQTLHGTLTKEDIEKLKLRSLDAIQDHKQLNSHTDSSEIVEISSDQFTSLGSTSQEPDLLRRNLKSS